MVSAELFEQFSTSGSLSVSVSGDGKSLELIAKGGKHGTQMITISKDTTFAYRLHKVKKWNKDKTEILEMEDDYKGMS